MDAETLLREAVNAWPQYDRGENEPDLNISGADMVDWFGEWRERAKALLDSTKARRRA